MKKRVVTENQYPIIDLEAFKILEDGPKALARNANTAWRESSLYQLSDFPKRRYYAVLAKSVKSGEIFGYNVGKNSPISRTQLRIYAAGDYEFRNKKFRLDEFRDCKYKGFRDADEACVKLRGYKGSEKFEIFVVRIGSKKCPIKVKLDKRSRRTGYAIFTLK